MPTAKRVVSSRKRVQNIFYGQVKRAKKYNAYLNYTFDDLLGKVNKSLKDGTCPYCRGELTDANFSADHDIPISRHGGWGFTNIIICCRNCNAAKGMLDRVEWHELLNVVMNWSKDVRTYLFNRLRAGGRVAFKPDAIKEPPNRSKNQLILTDWLPDKPKHS